MSSTIQEIIPEIWEEKYRILEDEGICRNIRTELMNSLAYQQLYQTAQQEGATQTTDLARCALEYSRRNLGGLKVIFNAIVNTSGQMSKYELEINSAINGIERILREPSKKE